MCFVSVIDMYAVYKWRFEELSIFLASVVSIYRPVISITHLTIHLSDSFFSEYGPWNDLGTSTFRANGPSNYSALPIYRGLFSLINTRKIPIPRPSGCLLWVPTLTKVLPSKLIVLCPVSCYIVSRYIESIVLTTWTKYYWDHWPFGLLSVGLLSIWINNSLDHSR